MRRLLSASGASAAIVFFAIIIPTELLLIARGIQGVIIYLDHDSADFWYRMHPLLLILCRLLVIEFAVGQLLRKGSSRFLFTGSIVLIFWMTVMLMWDAASFLANRLPSIVQGRSLQTAMALGNAGLTFVVIVLCGLSFRKGHAVYSIASALLAAASAVAFILLQRTGVISFHDQVARLDGRLFHALMRNLSMALMMIWLFLSSMLQLKIDRATL